MTRVLVVDDDAPIRLLCRVNLEAEGMEVLEAADGADGLEKARSAQPDVVLLDVMLPKLDGWRVAEALLDDPTTGEIPIVFLTARAELRDQARGLEIGGDRLHHEAVQPGRARRPDPRAARPRPARRADEHAQGEAGPPPPHGQRRLSPHPRCRAVCASTIPPSTIAPPTIWIGSSASSSQIQARRSRTPARTSRRCWRGSRGCGGARRRRARTGRLRRGR